MNVCRKCIWKYSFALRPTKIMRQKCFIGYCVTEKLVKLVKKTCGVVETEVFLVLSKEKETDFFCRLFRPR
jgi:hypothetical protein